MDQIIYNLRWFDKYLFFSLNNLTKQSEFWSNLFYWFAEYGIVLIVIGLIYLTVRVRIIALFTALMSTIFSAAISFFIYFLWQRPRPFVTYASEVSKLAIDTTSHSFPSAHTYLAFSISIAVLLRGHTKLGVSMILISTMIAISRVGSGLHYPSDIIGGATIGLIAAIIAFWVVEHFEDFWAKNSAI